VTDQGFCKCDLATGWVKKFTTYAVSTAPAYTGTTDAYNDASNAPCLAAAYKPGFDFNTGTNVAGSITRDECWGTGTAAYADDTALKAASPGCIKSTTSGFAVCDTANGWVKPTYTGDIIDNSWNGKCIPACYKSGEQETGAGTTPGVDADGCWHASSDVPYATVYGGAGGTLDTTNADLYLSQLTTPTGALGVQGCGIVSSSIGFCECKLNWLESTAADGTCISPCH